MFQDRERAERAIQKEQCMESANIKNDKKNMNYSLLKNDNFDLSQLSHTVIVWTKIACPVPIFFLFLYVAAGQIKVIHFLLQKEVDTQRGQNH